MSGKLTKARGGTKEQAAARSKVRGGANRRTRSTAKPAPKKRRTATKAAAAAPRAEQRGANSVTPPVAPEAFDACAHDAVMSVLDRLAKRPAHPDHLVELDRVEQEFGPLRDRDVGARRLVAHARWQKVVTLERLGRAKEAIAVCDELVAASAADPDPEVRRSVCRVLFGKAKATGRGNPIYRRIQAIAALAPPVPDLAAEVIYNQGIDCHLADPPRLDAAEKIYLALLDEHGDTEDFEVRRWVNAAAFSLCSIKVPAITTSDDVTPVIAELAADRDWRRRYAAASALMSIGTRLLGRNEDERAIAVYESAHALFGARHHRAPLRALAASAMMNRGYALGRSRGPSAEVRGYDELFSAYGDAREPIVRRWVAAAEHNAAMTLRDSGDTAALRPRLERMLEMFGNDPGPAPLLRDVTGARMMLVRLDYASRRTSIRG